MTDSAPNPAAGPYPSPNPAVVPVYPSPNPAAVPVFPSPNPAVAPVHPSPKPASGGSPAVPATIVPRYSVQAGTKVKVPIYLWVIFAFAIGLVVIMIVVVAFQGKRLHDDVSTMEVLKNQVGAEAWKKLQIAVDSAIKAKM